MDFGMYIKGIFCGGNMTIKDGKTSYTYLLTDGNAVSYRIKCNEDLFSRVSFGDTAEFKVRCNAFNGAVYFSGEYVGVSSPGATS